MNFEEQLAICEAATPGPWHNDGPIGNPHVYTDHGNGGTVVIVDDYCNNAKNDAAFMAAARQGYPEALRRLMRLRELATPAFYGADDSLRDAAITEMCELLLETQEQ